MRAVNEMNEMNGAKFQFLGRRSITRLPRAASNRRRALPFRKRTHDPMLVLNMSVFNSADGWRRTFDKLHENAA